MIGLLIYHIEVHWPLDHRNINLKGLLTMGLRLGISTGEIARGKNDPFREPKNVSYNPRSTFCLKEWKVTSL